MPQPTAICSALVLALAATGVAGAQSLNAPVHLIVEKGRPLEVVLDERVTIKHVGQEVQGKLVDPIYVYDRMVVPAGTRVSGHVVQLEGPSTFTRVRAALSGDLTPSRRVALQFNRIVDGPSGPIPLETVVTAEIPQLKEVASSPSDEQAAPQGRIGRAEREARNRAKDTIDTAKQTGHDVLAQIRQPGRLNRLKEMVVARLPYHPQVIRAGTAYHAELLAPLDFGEATPVDAAPQGERPAPSSLLRARLVSTIDSSNTPRGSMIHAVVTEPVFSADGRLILPEGAALEGEVTLSRPARRFHSNGQLRFLFERVQTPFQPATPLLASLESVQASGDAGVSIDDEGGTTLTNSKTRFIAPALAIVALRANFDHDRDHLDPDGDGHMIHSSNSQALGVGGFFGLGVLGVGLSQISRPIGVALSVVGAARTLYTNVLGKGREVQFPADTLMQLQLAPGPSRAP